MNTPFIRQFGKIETKIDMETTADGFRVRMTESRHLSIDKDELARRSVVLKDDDGNVIAALVG